MTQAVTLINAPLDAATIAATASPIERARLVGLYARRFGTLPTDLAELRRDALLEARAEGRRVTWIAEQVGLTPSRVSQLTAEQDEQPCPDWCEAVRHGYSFAITFDAHFARRGVVTASLVHDPQGEPGDVSVEIVQDLVGDGEPVVSVRAEYGDDGLRLTDDETERHARNLLKAAVEVRAIKAHLRRCKRPATEAA